MITTHTTCQICYNKPNKRVIPALLGTSRGLATSSQVLKGKRCYMTTISPCPRILNSSSLTLQEALFAQRHAIHREPGVGCIFVADNTHIGNGYRVYFSNNPNAPIQYPAHVAKGEAVPYIVASDSAFYRTFTELEYYLLPQSRQAGWECVPVISNGKEVM